VDDRHPHDGDRHLEALETLGLSPTFSIGEAQAVLKTIGERLEQEHARQRAIREQQRKAREEVARLRSGRVVADHDDDREGDDGLLVWKPDLWRR
jgi:hypothetical protein